MDNLQNLTDKAWTNKIERYNKSQEIEIINKNLKDSTTISLWNNQTLKLHNKESNWWYDQIELQIIDETNQTNPQKIWELICSIEWNKANLSHRLVQKESLLKWFELLQIMEDQLKKKWITELTMQCSQIDIVERWKKQWFHINKELSNSLAEEYSQHPEQFTVYNFDLNMWHKLNDVSIKKDILQEILLIKLERNDMNRFITKDDLEEYCKIRNIDIKYTEEYIKQISPRFYLMKDL